ncbi:hypothetical protein CVT24_005437, partial [Panaeolus cyanescens]
MAKKQKGKQKDEKPQSTTAKKDAEPEPIPIPAPVVSHNTAQDEQYEYTTSPPSAAGGWGDNASFTAETWGAPQQQDTWVPQPSDAWEDQHQLPQQLQNNRALETITEISSPIQSTRRQSLAPSATYSADNWDQQQQPVVWGNYHDEGPPEQSRTLTATPGDRSRVGSPPPHPPVSIHDAAMAAHHAQNQKFSTASEAARKFEETKGTYPKSPFSNHHSDLHSHHELSPKPMPAALDIPVRKPLSTASAYAREHTYTHRRRSSAPSPQSSQSPATTTSAWTGPKSFAPTPTSRKPAPIPSDPSWIHTGGNTWSNNMSAKYSSPTANKAPDPWADFRRHDPPPQPQPQPQQAKTAKSTYSHDAWSQQFQQRHNHPQPHHAQHRKHHSYAAPSAASFTAHSLHGRNGVPQHHDKNQNQSWEAWGKHAGDEDDEDDDDYETEDGTYEDYPDDGWGQTAGSRNGHQRGKQNASEEWSQWGQPAKNGWGQQDWNSMKG